MSFLFPSPTITFDAALRDLAAGSPKARAMAAHALGDVTDPAERRRAVDALIRALDDDRPEVRAEACASLGDLGEPGSLAQLIRRLDDGAPVVRQNAAIALGSIGHPDGFEALATALREGPADLRFQAATSLAEIDPARAFEPVLAALDDGDPQVVGASALSLGAIASGDHKPRALAALAGKLDHPDTGTRFDVAYALAELGDPAGQTVLSGALADVDRAWDAVSALALLRDTAALGRAIAGKRAGKLARDTTPAEAQVLAAGRLLALEPAGDQHELARRVLIDALTARKVHVRGLAVEQLAEVGGAWAAGPLDKLARSSKGAELREAIAIALRAIEQREGS